MPISSSLHPVRWQRTRPWASDMVRIVNGVRYSGGDPVKFATQLYQSAFGLLMEAYNRQLLKLPLDRRPKDTRVLKEEMELGFTVSSYIRTGRNAFSISPVLQEALENTDLTGVRASDLRLPFDTFYVSMSGMFDTGLPGSQNVFDGCYVHSGEDRLEFTLVTRRTDIDTESSSNWPFNRDTYFRVPLDLSDGRNADTIEDLLNDAIRTGEINLDDTMIASDPEWLRDDGSGVEFRRVGEQLDARDARWRKEALPAAKRALALVVNTLAWLTAEPEEVEAAGVWPDDVPEQMTDRLANAKTPKAKAKAAHYVEANGYTMVRMLGRELERPEAPEGEGQSLSEPHWRRGHWRRQAVGPGRSARSLTWIKPTIVRRDLGLPPKGHVYVP